MFSWNDSLKLRTKISLELLVFPFAMGHQTMGPINSLRLDNAKIRQWIERTFVKKMACRLPGARNVSADLSDTEEQTSVNFLIVWSNFHCKKRVWKCRLENDGHQLRWQYVIKWRLDGKLYGIPHKLNRVRLRVRVRTGSVSSCDFSSGFPLLLRVFNTRPLQNVVNSEVKYWPQFGSCWPEITRGRFC